MSHPITSPKQLGEALRGYRKKQQLTQQQVGSKVGLLQKTVSTVENETERTSVAQLFKLLSALGLELVVKEKPASQTKISEW